MVSALKDSFVGKALFPGCGGHPSDFIWIAEFFVGLLKKKKPKQQQNTNKYPSSFKGPISFFGSVSLNDTDLLNSFLSTDVSEVLHSTPSAFLPQKDLFRSAEWFGLYFLKETHLRVTRRKDTSVLIEACMKRSRDYSPNPHIPLWHNRLSYVFISFTVLKSRS